MTIIKCTKKISFDAAHRIVGHQGKCRFLHGHRYVCEATFVSDTGLDELGMVIDFKKIKRELGKWIDDNLDHNLILAKDDTKLLDSLKESTEQNIYIMDAIPTSENIALHLLNDICPKLFADDQAHCAKIKLSESANSFVEVYKD